jgi:hypothetical protein
MDLRDEKMHLNKATFELRSATEVRESDHCGVRPSLGGRIRLGHLTRLVRLMQHNQAGIDACAHSEMRRAQTDARRARENTLASIQLARQLAK